MALIIKVIIVLFLVAIFFALGSALYFLIQDRQNSTRMVKALTWRISLSIVLFLILIIAAAMGWLTPNPTP